MLLKYTKKKKKANFGFTITEMIITVIVVSILAAVTTPSLMGLFNQNQVKEGFNQVKGAIKESQRQAMRRGRLCKIDIDTVNQKVDISSPDSDGNYTGCLFSERTLPDGVLIKTNLSPAVITFSPKGNTSSAGTIVAYHPSTEAQKCLVISLGLGIMRSGDYTGDVSGSVTADDCDTTDS